METTVTTLDGQTVRIGIRDYDITTVAGLRGHDDTPLYGVINFGQGTIRLEQDLRPDYSPVVLWHEIVHGILETSGQEQSERICDAMAYGIVQILRDNPWLRELSAAMEPVRSRKAAVR